MRLFFESVGFINSSRICRGSASFNDTDVAFYGSWSQDNSQFGKFQHTSTSGDVAKSSFQGHSILLVCFHFLKIVFKGESLLLYGATGPSSGSYGIALNAAVIKNQTDHRYITTGTFTAHTPFTNPNALLFYALDLDPTIPYSLTITNEGGGELSLNMNGFQVFVPQNPLS